MPAIFLSRVYNLNTIKYMATNTEKTNTVIKNMKSLFGEILNQVKDLKG